MSAKCNCSPDSSEILSFKASRKTCLSHFKVSRTFHSSTKYIPHAKAILFRTTFPAPRRPSNSHHTHPSHNPSIPPSFTSSPQQPIISHNTTSRHTILPVTINPIMVPRHPKNKIPLLRSLSPLTIPKSLCYPSPHRIAAVLY